MSEEEVFVRWLEVDGRLFAKRPREILGRGERLRYMGAV